MTNETQMEQKSKDFAFKYCRIRKMAMAAKREKRWSDYWRLESIAAIQRYNEKKYNEMLSAFITMFNMAMIDEAEFNQKQSEAIEAFTKNTSLFDDWCFKA